MHNAGEVLSDIISIHALREEGDTKIVPLLGNRKIFLSTPSARRATKEIPPPAARIQISIHALREEGDGRASMRSTIAQIFLSTPSARRATYTAESLEAACNISIHALREEGDSADQGPAQPQGNFYPRPPRGGRHAGADRASRRAGYFYPRPPRGGRRYDAVKRMRARLISIHALREEGDRWLCKEPALFLRFLSTPSARRATEMDRAWISEDQFLSTPSARRAT